MASYDPNYDPYKDAEILEGANSETGQAGVQPFYGSAQMLNANLPMLRSLGFTGQVTQQSPTTQDGGGDVTVTPEFTQWMNQNGYSLTGETQGNSNITHLVDSSGKVLGSAGLSAGDDPAFLWQAPAMVAGGAGLADIGLAAAGAAGTGGGVAAATTGAGAGGMSSADLAAIYGDAGYGAGMTGAETAAYGGGAGAMTTAAGGAPSSTSGFWNGTDFSGTSPMSTAVKGLGGSSMGASDWIQLANLGAGLYAGQQAGDRSEAATDAAAAAAQGQLALSQQAFDWYKQTYADEAGDRKAASDRQNAISDAQLAQMQFATDQAKDLDTYNKTTFRPLEQKIVSDAQGYDTAERRAGAAASAAADVDMSAAAATDANNRALARAGIAPGSAKALAIAQDSAVAQSAARGGAMTQAARNVEQQGYARTMDAAALGRNIASNQATQQSIANTTGNSSASTAGAALNSTTSGDPLMTQGFNTAINGSGAAGNLFNSIAKTDQGDDQLLLAGLSGLGKSLGSIYGTSDKNVKKGTGRMANTAKALKEVEKTPVHEGWQYDPKKGGPDDGGKKHIGPMAQTVRRVSGEAAAPGGKVIDLVNAQGRMTAAVQELSRRVRKLEERKAA